MAEKNLSFNTLISSIQHVHGEMASQASKAVNISLTLRNWIIGCYIAKYELRGADRAEYGQLLFATLAKTLKNEGISNIGKRQIGSLYYERSGLSGNNKKLAEMVQFGVEAAEPKLAIRDPYIFEFLGLKPKEVMGESDLEDGLLDKLQDFLLELGHGFCFESRQKRILIGDTHGFIDLVFYHRILKCHVLIDLKLEKFSHKNIGQLNTYVSWYKQNMMTQRLRYIGKF